MFGNILVPIDLTRCQPLETASLDLRTLETVQCALTLGRSTGAELCFFSSFDITEEALHQLDPQDRSQIVHTVEEQAERVLDDLVSQAKSEHVGATRKLALGKAWLEIIREVLRAKPDLVIVGTRELSAFRRMLFGNTAMKLLRRCPCPVWVAKPGMKQGSFNILVATDLKPAGEEAMDLGIDLAESLHADVHILHVIEYPLDRLGWTGLPDQRTTRYHAQVRRSAEQTLEHQLERTQASVLGSRCHVHLVDGVGIPDVTIQQFIQSHAIDLLVMGTIGRAGISGVMIGNTAERLLPEVHCSVLAVKPPDFCCPVT